MKGKLKREVSLVLVLLFIVTTITVAVSKLTNNNTRVVAQITEDDKRVAAEISNMTGEKSEKILELKSEGLSWNEVLEKLKNNGGKAAGQPIDTLVSEDFDEAYVNKLKSEGFSIEEITEAKMNVDKLISNLKEITSDIDGNSTQNGPVITDKSGQSGITAKVGTSSSNAVTAQENNNGLDNRQVNACSELLSKIDVKKAVYLTLKLKNDFGSIEAVLDEYIYSLQIEANLETYLTDKKAYEESKNEKSAGIDKDKIITLAKIEEMVLLKVQQGNIRANTDISNTNSSITNSGIDNKMEGGTPSSPLPEETQVKPEKPGQDIMDEINNINNNSGVGRR